MRDEEDDLELQPLGPSEVDDARLQIAAIKRANALLELEELCAEADKAEELTLRDLGGQFGIRHLLLATTLSAFALTLIKQFGLLGAITGIPLAVILGGWLFIHDWQQTHAAEMARRHRQFRFRHRDVALAEVGADLRWKVAYQESRSPGGQTLQAIMLCAAVLVLFAAHWFATSQLVAVFLVCVIVLIVSAHVRLGTRYG